MALKLINAFTPLPPEQWALTHPQGEDETASDRIDLLTRYRACCALHTTVTNAGHKISKLLGRGYLRGTRLWNDVVAAQFADAVSGKFPAHTVAAFCDGWAKAAAADAKDDESDSDLVSLVWAADFNAALEQRRAARRKEIIERRERLHEQDNEADQLRAALRPVEEEEEEEEEQDDEPMEEEDEPRVVELSMTTEELEKRGVFGM